MGMPLSLYGEFDMNFPRYACNSLSAYFLTVGLMQVYAAISTVTSSVFVLTDFNNKHLNGMDFHSVQMISIPGASSLDIVIKVFPHGDGGYTNIDYVVLGHVWRINLE